MKLGTLIDVNKICAPLICAIIINRYGQWENLTAIIYFALHGTYGFLNSMKSIYFPSSIYENENDLNLKELIQIQCAMLLFLSPLWLICRSSLQAPSFIIFISLVVYIIGIFFYFVSEMHKFLALQTRKELVTNGLWSLSRNINYFGELLIHLSLATLSMHCFPYLYLNLVVTFLWWPNILRLEKSLSRHSEYKNWKENTAIFIPYVY